MTLSIAKIVSMEFASLGLIFGIVACVHWLHASGVDIVQTWRTLGRYTQSGDSRLHDDGWTYGLLDAVRKASDLNRRAAIWTMLSVAFSALATFASVVFS